jgi:hypothetical protein
MLEERMATKTPPSRVGRVQKKKITTVKCGVGTCDGLVTRNLFCCRTRKRRVWEDPRREIQCGWEADGRSTKEPIKQSLVASGHLAGTIGG